jgi:hypothetical protein
MAYKIISALAVENRGNLITIDGTNRDILPGTSLITEYDERVTVVSLPLIRFVDFNRENEMTFVADKIPSQGKTLRLET